MSDNELRDRIARVLFDRDQVRLEQRGYFKVEWGDNVSDWEAYVKPWLDEAQAIIDELGLYYETALGGSHEHPNQRHRFVMGRWEKQ